MSVKLPPKRVHKTPRILVCDAYTAGSPLFMDDRAKEKSIYYITFRRTLREIDPDIYDIGDDRMIFVGLQRILEDLFYEPVTMEEIEEADRFMSDFRIKSNGERDAYYYPREMWVEIVNKYNGRPPILIEAMPEGSVVYPNEPVIQITSLVEGWGELAAWFESKLLQVWAASERATRDEHWRLNFESCVRYVHGDDVSSEQLRFITSLMLTDFGDRAGMNGRESEDQGMTSLYIFGGTDTLAGAYQAWKNSGEIQQGSSVYALAHRNVQACSLEENAYKKIFELSGDNSINSMVADCYDYYYAVENYLLPLALQSASDGSGRVVVARPDSGNALEQVLWTCNLAVNNGLFTTEEINGRTWKKLTTLRFIEGDGMNVQSTMEITWALLNAGFIPWECGLFGVGGGRRNELKRDNFSAKYALCSVGNDNTGVIKFSMTEGKGTLAGPFKILRSPEALDNCQTIVSVEEDGLNWLIPYYNGSNLNLPFGVGQWDTFTDIKNRIHSQMTCMPLSLTTDENKGYPASDKLLRTREELRSQYVKTTEEVQK